MSIQLGQASPAYVQLVVEQFSDSYGLRLTDNVDMVSIKTGITEGLLAYVAKFPKAAPAACGGPDWLKASPETRSQALGEFAKYGREIFHAIVPDANDRNTFRKFIEASDAGAPLITAVNRAALIPWEILHLSEADEPLDVRDFFGWSHVAVRTTSAGPRGRVQSTRAISKAKVVEDNVLNSVGTGRAKEARERYVETDYPVLQTLSVQPDDIQKFHDFLFPDEDIVDLIHFDTHVNLKVRPAGETAVRVTTEFMVSAREFEPDKLDIGHLPLVFFNGCHGGTAGTGELVSLASLLRSAGAASVLAGECEIGDDFAAAFAETFYSLMAHAPTVGIALLRTRRKFLGYDHNPMGLFYGLYGSADLPLNVAECVEPAPGSALAERLAWDDQAA